MTQSITSSTSASAAASSDPLASATSQSQALGKDAFMKLLVAQISHQDPLQPMDDTAFVSQLAQFSALEQQLGTNKLLELVATQQQGLANDAVSGLVGKRVTMNGSTVALDGSGSPAALQFSLAGPSNTCDVTITDASGKVVRTMHLGAEPGGLVSASWDGKDDGGTQQAAGSYTISVTAKDASGNTIATTEQSSGTVASVGFDKGYATLTLDTGASAPASQLVSVDGAAP